MSTERRYNEEEIASIFKQAVADQEAAQRNLPHGGGLTLSEIEQIGKEAGITPEFIARAAAGIDSTPTIPAPTTFLGLPISVARTVDLPGSFSDKDWNLLVADLHDTFGIHGKIQLNGSIRQWRYGNIQVMVEPTETGHRLRLRTLSDKFRSGLTGGLTFLAMGLFFMLLVASKGQFGLNAKTLFVSMFALVGLGGMGISAFGLPRWRSEREQQMESIAARAVKRAAAQTVTAPQTLDALPASNLDLDQETAEEELVRRSSRVRS